jgi:hypothetical protein
MAAHAAALLVTRQVIAIDRTIDRADGVDETLNHARRQKFRQVKEGPLGDEVAPQLGKVKATKLLAQTIGAGARLCDGVYEDTSAFERASVDRGLRIVRR